jgi:hypothetical protein
MVRCAPANTIVGKSLNELEEAWLGPPDNLMNQRCSDDFLPRSQHIRKQAPSFELVTPSSWYEALHIVRGEEGFRIPKTFYKRFWRACSVGNGSPSNVEEVPWMDVGEQSVDNGDGRGIGYWICDSPDVMDGTMSCFGT